MQEFLNFLVESFQISYGLRPYYSIAFIIFLSVAVPVSLWCFIHEDKKIVLPVLFVGCLSITSILLFLTGNNNGNYFILKDGGHDISVEEYIFLEQKRENKLKQKEDKLKQVEELYGLSSEKIN